MTIGRQYQTSDPQTSDEYQPSEDGQFGSTADGQFRTTEDGQFPTTEDGQFRSEDDDPSQTSVFEPVGTSEEGTLDGSSELTPDASRDESFDAAQDQWETPSQTGGANDLPSDLSADTRVVETPVVEDGARAPEHALDDRWSALQGAFVDDPDTAVKDAAALVDDAMQQLLQNLQSEQSGDSSTEQKRLAFQRYRAVHEVLTRV